jgi:hypothetical protein
MLKKLYERFDLLQRRMSVKVVLTMLLLIGLGGGYGTLIFVSYDLDAQRTNIERALINQNIERGDPHAVSLYQTGRVTINGITYGDDWMAGKRAYFNKEAFIAAPGVIADEMIDAKRPAYAPAWLVEQPGTTWLLAVLSLGILLLVIWGEMVLEYAITVLCTGVGYVFCRTVLRSDELALSIAVMGNLIFSFILLTRILQFLFSSPHQVLAVAHTVLKEASRTRIAMSFIVVLLVLLPLIPLSIDQDAPMRFQVQTFISRSLGLTFVVSALFTLFISCSTVAFEIRDRQIWQLVSKPLNRFQYLMGKWVGVMSVNLVLLVIASLCSFVSIQYMRMQPVDDSLEAQIDALQLRDQVLVARNSALPNFAELSKDDLDVRVENMILKDPELSGLEVVPRSTRLKLAKTIQQQFNSYQRSIPPWYPDQENPASLSYEFSGLQPARELDATLTLRFRFYILDNNQNANFRALFIFNDDPESATHSTYIPTQAHVIPLPSSVIRDDGTLKVTIYNLYRPPQGDPRGSLNFDPDGLELLYKVGSFEMNFARAVLITWIKLAVLGALGICLASFLNFPVACLFAFTIFIGGTLSPFLAESLREYYPPPMQSMDWGNLGMVIQWAFQSFVRWVAQGMVFMLDAFGKYRPTDALVEGKYLGWDMVIDGFFRLGLLWSCLSMLLGYLVLRKRQLAIYSGSG